MCIAVPGEIVDIYLTRAKVKIMGAETTVNIQLIESPKVGEYVLVHAGCAIETISKDFFDDISNIFQSMTDGDEYSDG